MDFQDRYGRKMKSQQTAAGGRPLGNFGKVGRTSLHFFIEGKPEKADITVTIFEKWEEIEVPIDIEVGLGLE